MPVKTTIAWEEIRERFKAGESFSALAKAYPVSRQAISARAGRERWRRNSDVALETWSQQAATKASLPAALGSRSPENAQAYVECLRKGLSTRIAARRVGMAPETADKWRNDDAEFDAICQAAEHEWIARKVGEVDDAGKRDWKASWALLEQHPLTKPDFQSETKGGGGITVIINVPEPDFSKMIDVTSERVNG